MELFYEVYTIYVAKILSVKNAQALVSMQRCPVLKNQNINKEKNPAK